MDWRERVNAEGEIVECGPLPGDPGEGLPLPPGPLPASLRKIATPRPCLYIGTSGQRCTRTATRGDFCSRHSAPNPSAPAEGVIVKRAVAVGGVLAVLWPIIFDLIRALLRFLR
jgi:hypothetical protein